MQVTLQNADRVQAKLDGPVLERPLVDGLTALASRELEEVRELFEGGTGRAARSVYARVGTRSASIVSAMPRRVISQIDAGRRPGGYIKTMVPGLIRWKEAVGYQPSVYQLAHEIRAEGTKGKRIMETLERRAPIAAEAVIREMDQAVEREWER